MTSLEVIGEKISEYCKQMIIWYVKESNTKEWKGNNKQDFYGQK